MEMEKRDAVVPKSRPQTPIALSIIINSQLFIQGLIMLLGYHLAFEVVSTYTQETCQTPLDNPANHVVLIDGSIEHARVIEYIRRWRTLQSAPHVVVLESSRETQKVLEYIEAGASGYCIQGMPAAEVAGVIEDALRGLARCSPKVTAELFLRLAARTKPTPDAVYEDAYNALTTREMEVLRCLALGYSNKQIAAELVITIYTVKHHVHNILDKLDIHHRRDASRLALARGWVQK